MKNRTVSLSDCNSFQKTEFLMIAFFIKRKNIKSPRPDLIEVCFYVLLGNVHEIGSIISIRSG